jgi:hypothetical protein
LVRALDLPPIDLQLIDLHSSLKVPGACAPGPDRCRLDRRHGNVSAKALPHRPPAGEGQEFTDPGGAGPPGFDLVLTRRSIAPVVRGRRGNTVCVTVGCVPATIGLTCIEPWRSLGEGDGGHGTERQRKQDALHITSPYSSGHFG